MRKRSKRISDFTRRDDPGKSPAPLCGSSWGRQLDFREGGSIIHSRHRALDLIRHSPKYHREAAVYGLKKAMIYFCLFLDFEDW